MSTNKDFWNKTSKREIIVPLAFGAPGDLPINKAIADYAQKISFDVIPIFAQLDVWRNKESNILVFNGKEHISTLEIAQEILAFCLKHKWLQENGALPFVRLVVAPPHKERAIRDFQMQGFQVLHEILFSCQYNSSFWYDPNSTQLRTRYPILWWPPELLLRTLPWKLYKKLTTLTI